MIWAVNIGLPNVTNSLQMSIEYIVLLIYLFGSIIFFAKDFKLGLVMLFFIGGLLFMMFYSLHMNYVPFEICFFISLVLLSLSFLAIAKSQDRGVVI